MSDKEFEILIEKLDRLIEISDWIDTTVSKIDDLLLNLTYGVQDIQEVAAFIVCVIIFRYCFRFLWDFLFKNV